MRLSWATVVSTVALTAATALLAVRPTRVDAETAHAGPSLSAQPLPAQPEGWSLQPSNETVVLSSPAAAGGAVVLFFIDRASRRTPDAGGQAHFTELTEVHAARLGKLTWREGVSLEQTLLRDAVTVEDEDGHVIHGYAFGYETPKGLQTLSIFWPDPLNAQSPQVASALDYVATLWKQNFSFDGTPPDVVAPPDLPETASNQARQP